MSFMSGGEYGRLIKQIGQFSSRKTRGALSPILKVHRGVQGACPGMNGEN